MAHVGVEGLAAGNAENHRGERDDAVQVVDGEKTVGMQRVEGGENSGLIDDGSAAKKPYCGKPENHDRAEHPADDRGSVRCTKNRAIRIVTVIGTT